jgi:hypothetical protein
MDEFFDEYHGHEKDCLEDIYKSLCLDSEDKRKKNVIFLAGDSSLDNKHWILNEKANSVNGYENFFEKSVKDVAFNINKKIVEYNDHHHFKNDYFCINTSVEASTLDSNSVDKNIRSNPDVPFHWTSDQFIQDHITDMDILIVSVGGNDIAFNSTTHLPFFQKLDTNPNDPEAIAHFKELLQTKLENYIKKLCLKNKPLKIIVCMIYYPSKEIQGSWAGTALSNLGYDGKGGDKLRSTIKLFFENFTKNITISGSEVIPCPLFETLNYEDGKNYLQRVEPSALGGKRMAKRFLSYLFKNAEIPDGFTFDDESMKAPYIEALKETILYISKESNNMNQNVNEQFDKSFYNTLVYNVKNYSKLL